MQSLFKKKVKDVSDPSKVVKPDATVLQLNGLELSQFPWATYAQHCPALTTLDLSSNLLTSFNDIHLFESLSSLNLDSNVLTEIPHQIGRLTNLRKLCLGGNRLTEIPDSIGKLDSLEKLDVSKNKILALPISMVNLLKLKKCCIGENPLIFPPISSINTTTKPSIIFQALKYSIKIYSDCGPHYLLTPKFDLKEPRKPSLKDTMDEMGGNNGIKFCITYTACLHQNNRKYMEDRCLIQMQCTVPDTPLPIDYDPWKEEKKRRMDEINEIVYSPRSAPSNLLASPRDVKNESHTQIKRPSNTETKTTQKITDPSPPTIKTDLSPTLNNESTKPTKNTNSNKEPEKKTDQKAENKTERKAEQKTEQKAEQKAEQKTEQKTEQKAEKKEQDQTAEQKVESSGPENVTGLQTSSPKPKSRAKAKEMRRGHGREHSERISLKRSATDQKPAQLMRPSSHTDLRDTTNSDSEIASEKDQTATLKPPKPDRTQEARRDTTPTQLKPKETVPEGPPRPKLESLAPLNLKVGLPSSPIASPRLALSPRVDETKYPLTIRSTDWPKDHPSRSPLSIFGIADGHGGSNTVRYVEKNLIPAILNEKALKEGEFKEALANAYKKIDYLLELELEKNRDPSGSTCVLALLHENYLLVSWIGDSRCVLCRGKKCIPMTVDHTPLRYDEKKRIEKMGGKVNLNDNTGDAPRVMQSLAVTRSFGDIKLKRNKFLIAEPEFTETLLEPEDRFVILASDGLWDVMSEEEAVAFVLSSEEPLSVSEQLLKRAIELGSVDNLSVIVVYFTWTLEKKL